MVLGIVWVYSKFVSYWNNGPWLIRACSIAWAELYLSVFALISRFDFFLYKTTKDDFEVVSDGFLPGTKSDYGLHATVKWAGVD